MERGTDNLTHIKNEEQFIQEYLNCLDLCSKCANALKEARENNENGEIVKMRVEDLSKNLYTIASFRALRHLQPVVK